MLEHTIVPLPHRFAEYLQDYCEQASASAKAGKHHDHRRALFIDFLRKAFGIEVGEIELEYKIKAAEARGRIDAFYRYVIFEVKTDLEGERDDAIAELTKYFLSRKKPSDYVAAVTDGLVFEVYDFDALSKAPKRVRAFELNASSPANAYNELDELLTAGSKIPPLSGEVVLRFGQGSLTFNRSKQALKAAFGSVKELPAVQTKFREWNALLAKVYGTAPEDDDLFIKHTYLTMVSRAIVTVALFPDARRGTQLHRGLINGDFFRNRNIQNLAEPDFFSWALETSAESTFFEFFANLFRRLGVFEWSDLDEDLLKMLYQELVDPDDRQLLGEFYTPDWLSELTLGEISYRGGTLLDPACGSGTFLFCAIRRIREAGKCGAALVGAALDSILGIDVHPVAVLMAKANILLALSKEIREYNDDVYLRVYLADTLMTGEDPSKRALDVKVSEKEHFFVPLDSLQKGRDLDALVDKMTQFARRGAASKDAELRAAQGFAKFLDGYTPHEEFLWRENFKLMVRVVGDGRDTVWGFILKNVYRPAYLRQQKVDFVVANPPWLSLRDVQDPAYKDRIKELAFAYNLLEKTERKLFTQLDTSTVFFAHSEHEFLRDGGTMAFVMPKSVILPAKQHLAFQKTGFSKILEFSAVKGLFKVPTCVLIRGADAVTTDIPAVHWAGDLVHGQRNMSWEQAKHILKDKESTWSFLSEPAERSPYYPEILQGATLVPRSLWFVEPAAGHALNPKAPFVRTAKFARDGAKKPWDRISLEGRVEREFLFATAVAEDLLPFALRQIRLVILPVVVRERRFVMVDSDEVLAEGAELASDWVKRSEKIWERRKKEGQENIYDYLNYDQKITNQNPQEKHVVLYNRSGTNIVAAYLSASDLNTFSKLAPGAFVADFATYRYYADSEPHALYLAGVLNSTVVNGLIKPWQTHGLQGERDITRRPFEVCAIPKFDPANHEHEAIACRARVAREKMVHWRSRIEGNAGQARAAARAIIRHELRSIDEAVQIILNSRPATVNREKHRGVSTGSLFAQ